MVKELSAARNGLLQQTPAAITLTVIPTEIYELMMKWFLIVDDTNFSTNFCFSIERDLLKRQDHSVPEV